MPSKPETVNPNFTKGGVHRQPVVSPELPEDPIVTRNLAMMTGNEMNDILSAESLGGNAGYIEIDGEYISCAALNGYADKSTGAITLFGNVQHVDEEIVRRDGHFTFTVAPSRRTLEKRIVKMAASKTMEAEGLERLQQSVDIYNKQAPVRAEQERKAVKDTYGSAIMRAVGTKV